MRIQATSQKINQKFTGTTMTQLASVVASLTEYDLMKSVLYVNGTTYVLPFWDWTPSRTRWAQFNYETSSAYIYYVDMVNSSSATDTLSHNKKSSSSWSVDSVDITDWTLYVPA